MILGDSGARVKDSFIAVQAVTRGGPEVLGLVDVPLRDPGSGEVRVLVEAAGVLLADVMWQRGAVPGSPKPPFVPGYDFVGYVDQVGDAVDEIAVNDRVAAMVQYGGYTEYAYVRPEKLTLIPQSVDAAEVICLTVGYVTAFQLFTRVAGLTEGQRVLVHGAAGGTGSAMIDVAALLGLEAFGTASAGKHALVRALGGTPIDYQAEDFVARVLEMTGGEGVDLVVDPIGGRNLSRSFRTLRSGGLVVSTAVMSQLLGGTSLAGSIGGMLGLYARSLWPNGKKGTLFDLVSFNDKNPGTYREDLTRLVAHLDAGQLHPTVAKRLTLGQARQAQELLLGREVQGKIVLLPARTRP